MPGWRLFWIPQDSNDKGVLKRLLADWDNLVERETQVGVRAGDPIFLSPDYRVDRLLSLYGQSLTFRRYTPRTRRNYATNICLLLTFLSRRDISWASAVAKDIEDYKHWRRNAETNECLVGGARWDEELAAFASLYRWAAEERHIAGNPVIQETTARDGTGSVSPAAMAEDTRRNNVRWLTPRTRQL